MTIELHLRDEDDEASISTADPKVAWTMAMAFLRDSSLGATVSMMRAE